MSYATNRLIVKNYRKCRTSALETRRITCAYTKPRKNVHDKASLVIKAGAHKLKLDGRQIRSLKKVLNAL